MELMSPLLLCALAALLPQALGVKSSFISEIKRESPKLIETPLFHKTVWLKRKAPSEVTLEMVLDYLHETDKCSLCLNCINKALYFLSSTKPTDDPPRHMPSSDFILNDIIENYHQYKVERNKRDTEVPTKTKKSNVSKSKNVTVTKYNIDGQIYAIKLRERNFTQTENQQGDRSCQVFSVRKYYPCDSPKAELIFTNARRKANKSNRRTKKQTKNTLTTDKPQSQSLTFRDKLLAEPFMTSIEELYN
ncbi:uncharacterized protein LOC133527181 [Cydia pomonella]|uniref:uncharacterized protein LOC133527181 n=1 Tax=Cydia pomonella TaxID=82600 RepID=UPI002ADE0648|nr:uncharacterized protein LOC133527181 [Cydia pomonella]